MPTRSPARDDGHGGRRPPGALVELDPAYCDVIVRRWQDGTGKRATRQDGSGLADAVAALMEPLMGRRAYKPDEAGRRQVEAWPDGGS